MRSPNRTIFLACALCALGPLAAAAEQHEAPPGPAYATAHYDSVEPSRVTEHEANARAWVEAFEAANMGPEWSWYTYSRSDFTYVHIFPTPNFAFFDASEARLQKMMEALGEEKFKELMKGAANVRAHHDEVVKHVPELSYMPAEPPGGQHGFAHLGVHTVKPAMAEQFREAVKKLVAAYRKVGVPHGFDAYEVQFGTGSYHFVTLAKDAAEFYGRPGAGQVLAQAESSEYAQQLYQEWRDCISAYETSDWTYRPDLSFLPAPPGPAEPEDGDGEMEGVEG